MDIRSALAQKKRLLIDGATGTMLQAHGMPAGVNPALFCMERPDIPRAVHEAYAKAGANILLTPTFGGSAYKLPENMRAFDFNKVMAENARQVIKALVSKVQQPLFVAGDIGPVGHFVEPLGDVKPEDLLAALREQVAGLVAGGVDAIFIETQFDLAETRIAVAAVRMETDIPIFASMTFEEGRSLTGSTPAIFAATMANMGVNAIGVNCGAGPEQMLGIVEELVAYSPCPVYAEPNAGLPELINGETVFRLAPQPFAEKTAQLARKGALVLGGCCGTTPEHIAALSEALKGVPEHIATAPVHPEGTVFLTSRSSLVPIGLDSPVTLIGERINPTGKKALSAEFQAGSFDLALKYAQEQVEAGTPVLDVNVGASHVKEEEFLPHMVKQLVTNVQTPLCLDSSNADALLAALPWHPGSALLNSISGEEGRVEKLAPACKLWGSPFVLLPLKGHDLPATAKERIAIIEVLLAKLAGYGIPRRLVMVDVLALTAASDSRAPSACLETLAWCKAHGLATTIGLSNISFGLPARDLVNSAFLAMAAGAGLSSCIGNPANTRLREALDAANLLLGHDEGATGFIASYAEWKAGSQSIASSTTGLVKAPLTLEAAVIQGARDAVIPLIKAALEAGEKPFAIVQERLIPAITEVGGKYERKEYFLPQLLRSAETMQTAFAYVKPLLEEEGTGEEKPVIMLATVEGDIHDIGKNIVALMLGNHGYTVIDLGKDVKAQTIVDAAETHKAAIIGLSALMTTTMPRMEDVVKLVKERAVPAKVIVGGAVVTQEYANSIGADGYSTDAVDAVRLAKRLLGV